MVFEILMMICFGLAWPINIYNSLRGKSTRGKNLLFLTAINLAYVFGIIYKVFFARTWALYIYIINFAMVLTDFILYFKNRHREIKGGKANNYYSLLC